MKNISIILLLVFIVSISFAQVDSTQNNSQPKFTPQAKKEKSKPNTSFNRVFFGGSLGFSFGSVTSIRVYPMVGYRLTPKLSSGVKLLYEYSSYDTYYGNQNYSNYGASLFARFRFIPQAYVHTEYSYVDYEFSGLNNEKYRQGVPFVFLGGGFTQRIGANSYAYAEILFDVLNDPNSPYAEWTPFYSVGVTVGF